MVDAIGLITHGTKALSDHVMLVVGGGTTVEHE